MQHPFLPDLSDKTLEELTKTIGDLQGKLNFVYKSQNQILIKQLTMVMEGYRTEYQNRMDALYKKQNIQSQINISSDKK
jgi:hypothetical protein